MQGELGLNCFYSGIKYFVFFGRFPFIKTPTQGRLYKWDLALRGFRLFYMGTINRPLQNKPPAAPLQSITRWISFCFNPSRGLIFLYLGNQNLLYFCLRKLHYLLLLLLQSVHGLPVCLFLYALDFPVFLPI